MKNMMKHVLLGARKKGGFSGRRKFRPHWILFAGVLLIAEIALGAMTLRYEFDGIDPFFNQPYLLVSASGGQEMTVETDVAGSITALTVHHVTGTRGSVAFNPAAPIVFDTNGTPYSAELEFRGERHSYADLVSIWVTHSDGTIATTRAFYVVNEYTDTDGDGLNDGDELAYQDSNGNRLNRFHWDTDRDGLSDGWEVDYDSALHPADGFYNSDDQHYNGDSDFMAQMTIEAGAGDHVLFHEKVYLSGAEGMYAGFTAYQPETAWGGNWYPYTEDYTATNEYLGRDRLPPLIWNTATYSNLICIATNAGPERQDQTNPLEWDTDGDSIPDGWELYVGMNPKDSGDSGADTDGDGLDNYEEWANYWDVNGNTAAIGSWSNKIWPTDPGVIERHFAWQNVWYDPDDNGIFETNDIPVWDGNWDSLHTNNSFGVTNTMIGRKSPKYPTRVNSYGEFKVLYATNGGAGGTGSAWADNGDGVFTNDALLPPDIPSQIMPPVIGDIGTDNQLYYYHNDFHPHDTDFDGLNDATVTGGGEEGAQSNPTTADTDGDWMPDGWERYAHADILAEDKNEDPDNDGLENCLEYWTGSVFEWMHIDVNWSNCIGRLATRSPMKWDKGNDGVGTALDSDLPYYIPPHFGDCPSFNVANGQSADSASGYAWYHTTRVDDPDSDYDGMDDYWEVYHGLNPLKGSRDLMFAPVPFTGGDRNLGTGGQTGGFDADTNTVGTFEIGYSTNVFTDIDQLIDHLQNSASYDLAVAQQVGPFNFGLELMDPDADGLPNLEEYSYETTNSGRAFYHTDPTPYLRTLWYPNAVTNSFTLDNYTFDNSAGWCCTWGWVDDGGFPFRFETVEGFDTDNDGIGDLPEVDQQVPSLLGGNNPIQSKNPSRNRCALFNYATGDFLRSLDAWASATPNQMNHFTVEAWIWPDDPFRATNQVIVDHAFAVPDPFNGTIVCSGYRLGIQGSTGRPFVMYNGRGSYQAYYAVAGPTYTLQTGQWTHVAGVFDGSNLMLYVNGQIASSIPSTELPVNGYNIDAGDYSLLGTTTIGARDRQTTVEWPLFLGAYQYAALPLPMSFILDTTEYYDGAIDEVRVWNGAVSQSSIVNLMRTRVARNATNGSAHLEHYYTFDECSDVDVNWPGGTDEPVVPANMGALQGANLPLHQTIYEWAILPQRSTIYTGTSVQAYNYLVFAEDMCAHQALVPPLDDLYHTYTTNGYELPPNYKNSMNPYERRWNLVRYKVNRPTLDLLFMNGAQADGDLLADNSWLYSDGPNPDDVDSDNDGMPDWWENQYGLDPHSDEGVNGATGDLDGDGLFNLYEYQAETNPRAYDSDNDGISDYYDDADGDGLSSGSEQDTYNTNPGQADTDDDNYSDGYEVLNNTSARYPRDPLIPHSMLANGSPVLVPEPRKVTIDDVPNKQRFENLGQWVVAAQVRPSGTQSGTIIRRQTDTGLTHFELRLNGNRPVIQFQTFDGIMHTVSAPDIIPANEFTPVMGQWDPDTRILSLTVDGIKVAGTTVAGLSSRGPGQTMIGDGFVGNIDDVYIGPEIMGESAPAPEYVLMMDVSGSMSIEGRMQDAKQAAYDAIDMMPEGAVMAIVSFESTAAILQDFTSDKIQLKNVVNTMQPLGGTNYKDPVLKLIELWQSRALRGTRIGIMISDGQPQTTPSESDLQDVVALSAVINTIGFGSSILQGFTAELERIANRTGGNFYAAPDGDDLAEILQALVDVEETENYGYYPFDDNASSAEDFTHLLDRSYVLTNLTFDAVNFTVELTDFNYAFADFDDAMPDWWIEWFLDDTDQTQGDDDPDGDGVDNLTEWQLSLFASTQGLSAFNPMSSDSDGNGTSDGNEDTDGDSLINRIEQNSYESRPDRLDTDDDGLNDNWETSDATDPADSISPFVMRSLMFGNSGGDGEVMISDKIRGVNTSRMNGTNWTVECRVYPEAIPPNGTDQALILRRLAKNDLVSYEMGLRGAGGMAVPYIRYNNENDTNMVEVTVNTEIPLGEWTHLAGRVYGNTLTLYIDGLPVRSKNVSYSPAQGVGDTVFGSAGFRGKLQEIRIWRIGRREEDIDGFKDRTILFDASAADPGLLRNDGSSGHLREIAAPGTTRDQLTEWTLSCWIRTTDSDGMFVSRVNTANQSEETSDFNYFIGVQGGRLAGKFAIEYLIAETDTNGNIIGYTIDWNDEVNTVLGQIPINDGEWHHVAYTRNTDNAVLYLDGRLEARQDGFLLPMDIAADIADSFIRILDGPVVAAQYLNGDVDEIRIWNRALSADEIVENMNKNLFGNETGLISYFNFDFQQGQYAEDRATVRDPSLEFGTYIPNAELVRTADQAPLSEFHPLRVYAFTSLVGYFPAVDGGTTVEDFLYPLRTEYAGVFNGDVQFDLVSEDENDSDGDGLPDSWETANGLNPGSDEGDDGAWGDPDGDGLNNRGEYLAGTDPWDFDTDGDGYGDYDSRAAPNARSWGELYSDGDGMDDSWEAKYPDVLSPLEFDADEDPDNDGWSNYAEFMFEGIIESNMVQRTDPSDPTSFPVPRIPMEFLGGIPAEGSLRVWIYSDQGMDGQPDARYVYTPDAEVPDDYFYFDWTETYGHVREGDAWMFAFGDYDDDGVCDVGEPAALAQYNPIRISWGDVPKVKFGMTDYPPAFGRFSWDAASADYYTITIQNLSQAGAPEILRKNIDAYRTFFHEGDYLSEGIYALPSGHYKWQVWAHNPLMDSLSMVDEDSFVVVNPAQQSTPTPVHPNGSQIVYARNEFSWMMDPSATRFRLQISPDRNFSTIIHESVKSALFREDDGSFEFYLPFYAGDGAFVNRPYYWRVQTMNGAGWSAYGDQAFTLNLYESPQGAYTISGEIMYFGKATNADLVVQAFKDRGFSGVPEAQVTLSEPGDYQLMGLRAGDYNVRAYFDQNHNNALDPWETSGFVKDPTVYASDYEPKSISVPGNKTGQRILLRDQDTDGDRIPDAWEWHFFGNLTTAFGTSDYDGDGVTDYDEILVFDTDPTDQNDKPQTQPQLMVEPAQLIVYAQPSQIPAAQANITVWNDGHGAVTYSVAGDQPWMSVTPGSGTSTGQENTHQVTFQSQPAEGDFSGHLIVNGGSGVGLQQSISVEYRVRNNVPQGALKVNITPADAVANGARWRVDNGAWLADGTQVQLVEGYYTLDFKAVTGYPTPAGRLVQVREDQTNVVSARYGARVPLDFDGDGKSDLSVFYEKTGDATAYSRSSAGGAPMTHLWGDIDIPVPADYDGDGVADMAFYYPAAGMWVVLNGNGTQKSSRQFGWGEAIPVPADYDGDAIDDIAVYWPTSPNGGTWYIVQSSLSGAVRQQGWGWNATVPVPGDYDGDGKTDIAVYWHETGMWYILRSGDGSGLARSWGWSSTVPVQGDYDGDGVTDTAVYWPDGGNWYIQKSSNSGVDIMNWGWHAAIPVPADYDGDGKTDAAVFWPVNGNWYIKLSGGGTEVSSWGWDQTVPCLLQYQINEWMGIQ